MTAFIGRREFITLLGSVAAVWPIAVRGEQSAKSYRIAFLRAEYPGEGRHFGETAQLERLHETRLQRGNEHELSCIVPPKVDPKRLASTRERVGSKTIRTC